MLGSLLAFLIPIFVAGFLPSEGYVRFALAWSLGQVFVVVFFEWLRLSLLRYGGSAKDVTDKLMQWYLQTSFVLVLIAGMAVAIPVPILGGKLLALSIVYAIAQGIFDGTQAKAKADFDDASYARSLIARAVLSVVAVVVVAAMTRNAVFAFLALIASYFASSAFAGRRAQMRFRLRWSAEGFRSIVFLGAGLAVAQVATLLAFLGVRWLIAHNGGPSATGGAILALDLTQRAVSVPVSAVNIVLVQVAILKRGGERSALNVTRHIVAMTACIVPIVFGLVAVLPTLLRVLVSEEYVGAFSATVMAASVCAGVAAFKVFAVESMQLVEEDGIGAAKGSIAGLIVAGVCVLLVARSGSPAAFVWALAVGLATSSAIGLLRLSVWRLGGWPNQAIKQLLIACGLAGGFFCSCEVMGLSRVLSASCAVALYGIVLLSLNFLECRLTLERFGRA
jgi:O-antigen/teichoic acid export membrane protein